MNARQASAASLAMDAVIARLLSVGTWAAVAVILAGVVGMLVTGVEPMAGGAIPAFDLARIPVDLLALRPEGFLWAGLLVVIALPIARVAVAGAGFFAAGERRLAAVSGGVLLVVLISIVAALGLEG